MGILSKLVGMFFGTSAEPSKTKTVTVTRPSPKLFTTIEESENNKREAWVSSKDVVSGMRFVATMQLRTPLRILMHHGDIHKARKKPPPRIAQEEWEGIWVLKAKTWRDMGVDIPEMSEGQHASAIGPIIPSEYLPFLIAVRQIIELREPIQSRVDKLREMLAACSWQDFVKRHGGAEKIVEYFFPRNAKSMPSLPDAALAALSKLGLDTPISLVAASDDALLKIKGIGPAKLKAIRAYCEDAAKGRDADRADSVIR